MSCPPLVPISVIPPVSEGVGPLVWRNGNQIARLNPPLNPSLVVYNGSVTTWGDGSGSAPIRLPNLQQVDVSTINYTVGLNKSGQLAAYEGVAGGSNSGYYQHAINNILTASGVVGSPISLVESLVQVNFEGTTLTSVYSHRPISSNLPGNGWFDGVSEVLINGSPLVADVDYVFYPDRQIFYFVAPQDIGSVISFTGYSFSAGYRIFITITDTLAVASSNINTSPVPTAVTGAVVNLTNAVAEYDADNNMVFLTSEFNADSLTASFNTNQAGVATIEWVGIGTIPVFPAITVGGQSSVTIASDLFTTVTSVVFNNVTVSPSNYTYAGKTLTFSTPYALNGTLVVNGVNSDSTIISYQYNQFKGSTAIMPTVLTDCIFTSLTNMVYYDGSINPTYTTFFYLSGNTLYLGDVFGLAGVGDNTVTTLTITCTAGTRTIVFSIYDWSGNIIYLPPFLNDVTSMSIDSTNGVVVFDYNNQKLWFTNLVTGTIGYNANFLAYQGKAIGGEVLEIVSEIPGLMATTCGTGEYLSTMTSENPSRNYLEWNQVNLETNEIQLIDEDGVWIYEDNTVDAPSNLFYGATADNIKPFTLKLPLAPLWPAARRNDTALMQISFAPTAGFPYQSSTFVSLDDGQRIGESSLVEGALVTMSSNTTNTVRGVNGIVVSGPIPSFYAGNVSPRVVMACYKWYAVKVTNPNTNTNFNVNEVALLCLHTINYESRTVGVTASSGNYTVASDLYKISV